MSAHGRRIAERLRQAARHAAIPVVLVAEQVALLVARLDDDDAVAADHDDRHARTVARRVQRKNDVVLGELLAQVRRDALGEASARIAAADRGPCPLKRMGHSSIDLP